MNIPPKLSCFGNNEEFRQEVSKLGSTGRTLECEMVSCVVLFSFQFQLFMNVISGVEIQRGDQRQENMQDFFQEG